MNTIEWYDSYSVGIKEIDQQHMELVAITNKLFQAIMGERGHVVLLDILRELERYVAYHFDYEEHLLREHGYPELSLKEHAEEHELLKRQVQDFITDYAQHGDTMDVDVFGFLRTWTDEHLGQSDSEYSGYLHSKGVS